MGNIYFARVSRKERYIQIIAFEYVSVFFFYGLNGPERWKINMQVFRLELMCAFRGRSNASFGSFARECLSLREKLEKELDFQIEGGSWF